MLRLPLPGAGELTLRCRVVRSFIHGFDRAPGEESLVRYRAALEFVGLTDDERAALRAQVDRAADAGSDDAELVG
jgi:hypothetical protein